MVTMESFIEQVKQIPDEKFPEYLFHASFRVPDEERIHYWYHYDMSDPRLQSLATVPKLKSYWKYQEYLNMWESYVNEVADRYGLEPGMIISLFEAGAIEEYIPAKPEYLKKSKEFKQWKKTGILPMKRVTTDTYMLEEAVRMSRETDTEDQEIIDAANGDIRDPLPEELAMYENADKAISARNRKDNWMKTTVNSGTFINTGFNLIHEYYSTIGKRESGEGSILDKSNPNNFQIDFDEAYKEYRREQTTPDYILEEELRVKKPNDYVFYDRRSQTYGTADESDFKQFLIALHRAGYDPRAFMGDAKRMSHKEVQMLESFGMESGSLTEKQRKKLLKKQKKKAMHHEANSNALSNVLSSNGVTYGNVNTGILEFDTDSESLYK